MTNISYNGYNANVISMSAETEIEKNVPVTVDPDGVCEAAAADADFIGVSVNKRQNIVSVQTEGYVTLPFSGDAPTTGFCGLVSDGNGGVKVSAEAAKQYKVLSVIYDDDDESITPVVGFML